MADQFIREYLLTITPESGESRAITDLKITFEITKSLLSYPNLAQIDIFNAAPETRSLLQRKGTVITLNAGYRGNTRLVFTGQIRNAFDGRTKNENITTVYAGDGQRDWEQSFFNKTFSKNTTVKKIFDEVAKSFQGLIKGDTSAVPDVKTKLLGETLSGKSSRILDGIASEFGLDWSIQDGQIVVTKHSDVLPGEAILISNETGMIGSPIITEIGADAVTLLNPLLLPNRAFKIESAGQQIALSNVIFRDVPRTRAEGFYKVQEVIFSGDSRSGEWVSKVKGILLK